MPNRIEVGAEEWWPPRDCRKTTCHSGMKQQTWRDCRPATDRLLPSAGVLLRASHARGAFLTSRTQDPHHVPNIKQQEKRVRSAARQRLENLRYRSTVKTLTKRLESAVADGNKTTITEEHRELVRMIDKAVSRGALHRNTAGRKKAQAARLVAGKTS